jgi:beta-glucosidase
MHPDIAAGVGGKTYRYFQGDVIWPFGFGLSYTSFAYQTTIDKTTRKKIGPCDNFTLSVVVQNTGEITGDEVVQLYLSLRNATVIVPVRQLVSFQRLRVEAHSEATVTFTVVPDDRFVLSAGDYNAMIEPGLIDVFIGGSSDPSVSPGVHFQIEVVGDPIEVASCPGGRSFHGTPGSPDAARWMPTETFPVWP